MALPFLSVSQACHYRSFLGVFISCVASLTASDGFACGKFIDHHDYPIVLRGQSELQGQPIDRLAAFAFDGTSWRRVAMQVDEVNDRGDYVLREGLPYTSGTGNGVFGPRDELVISGRDLGLEEKWARFPSALRDGVVKAWRVQFCNQQRNYGSLLVVSYDDVAPVFVPEPEIRFDAQLQQVTGEHYRYVFRNDQLSPLGAVYLRKDGEEFLVFERSQFMMPLRLPWYLPDFTISDRFMESSIESWQQGPLRTIVAVGVKFKGILSLFDFHMFTELIFYRNMFQIPTVIEFTLSPQRFLRPGSGLVYTMSFPDGRDWDLETNLVSLPAQSPSEVFQGKERAADFSYYYAEATRPEGHFRVVVRVDESAAASVPPPYLITREIFPARVWQEHWPWLRSVSGDLGIFVDISGVAQGSYDFGLDLFLESGAEQGPLSAYEPIEARWTEISIE